MRGNTLYCDSSKGERNEMSELYSKMHPFLGDEQKLIQRMAGQMDLWEECVRLFPREELIEEMDVALREENAKAFYGAVHRLKGNLANFGFDAAAETAMDVLRALREENAALAKERYGKLREEYLQIIERLDD